MTLTYTWLHIPSGRLGYREYKSSRAQLLEDLNKWNRQGRGEYQYWTDS